MPHASTSAQAPIVQGVNPASPLSWPTSPAQPRTISNTSRLTSPALPVLDTAKARSDDIPSCFCHPSSAAWKLKLHVGVRATLDPCSWRASEVLLQRALGLFGIVWVGGEKYGFFFRMGSGPWISQSTRKGRIMQRKEQTVQMADRTKCRFDVQGLLDKALRKERKQGKKTKRRQLQRLNHLNKPIYDRTKSFRSFRSPRDHELWTRCCDPTITIPMQ
ncbi:hypothetical protein BKA65DRAFT_690 [Rhexocercosporidium sp. MPI-PUGE-AT-0058]|nr:hypothetical protein BKA65DRAFT_690 [Rhexocercosporidium sp. MPI-PUGE-AT-0058]